MKNFAKRDVEFMPMFNLETFEELENVKLPSMEMVQGWKEHNDRIIVLDSTIDIAIMEYMRYIIQWNKDDKNKEKKDRKPIRIYLYSYGGDSDIMMSMIDILKLSKTPIVIINLGQACSAASLIFMAKSDCITRLMLKQSKIVIHQGQVGLQGQTNSVLDIAEDIKKNEGKIKKYVLENTKIESKLYDRKKRNEWTLTSDQALELGVCDKIVEDIDEIF